MKAFLVWLSLFVLGYGGLAGGYHYLLSSNPERIAVVVDSSFAMRAVWDEVPGLLEELRRGQKYAEFALMSEKRLIHRWQERPSLGNLKPYAPLDLSRITGFEPIAEASRVVLITNAPDEAIDRFSGWEVVRGDGW